MPTPPPVDYRAIADAANSIFRVWGPWIVGLLALGLLCWAYRGRQRT